MSRNQLIRNRTINPNRILIEEHDLGSAFDQHAQPHESDSDSEESPIRTQTRSPRRVRRMRTNSDSDNRPHQIRRISTNVIIIPKNGPVMDEFGYDHYNDFNDWKRRSFTGRVMVAEQKSKNEIISKYNSLISLDEEIDDQYGNQLGMDYDQQEEQEEQQAILRRFGLPDEYIPRNRGGKKKSSKKGTKKSSKKGGKKKSSKKGGKKGSKKSTKKSSKKGTKKSYKKGGKKSYKKGGKKKSNKKKAKKY
tara:strand:- start:22 stop:768 length:747 start_codon:yes stop_codon:yes gene_type:complete